MTAIRTQATTNSSSLNEYIPKNKFVLSKDCPVTDSEFNWLFKQREQNGFAKAFVKLNARSFLIHVPTFIQCLSEKKGA
jgi:hypothetical protein